MLLYIKADTPSEEFYFIKTVKLLKFIVISPDNLLAKTQII